MTKHHQHVPDLSKKSAKGECHESQKRSIGLFKRNSDYDRVVEHPQVATDKGHNPKGMRVHKCVSKMKGKEGVNPYAVCQASTKQSYKTGKAL